MKCFLSFILLVAFSIGSGKAQSFDPQTVLTLQTRLDSLRNVQQVQGITAAVILPSGAVWAGVSGFSHPGVPVIPEMLFGIGSNTKLFTAVSILKLVESGTVQLDDSLHEWLPAYTNIDSNITIRQLLNHTSGLADITSIQGYPDTILNDPYRIFTRNELLAMVGTPQFAPGTGWSYCNTNYILAGMVVEAASSQTLGQFLRQQILSPLLLDSTFLAVEDSLIGPVAHPWINNTDIDSIPRISTNSAAWASGAMYSNATEMAQWYRSLFSGGVLGPTAFNEMTTPVGPNNYGMGISRQLINGRTMWGHTGNIRGYLSCFLHDVVSGISVAVIINEAPSTPALVAAGLMNTTIGALQSLGGSSWSSMGFTVYPNPARERFEISSGLFHEGDKWRSSWYDLQGRLLETKTEIAIDQKMISVAYRQAGVYLVSFQNVKRPEERFNLKIHVQ